MLKSTFKEPDNSTRAYVTDIKGKPLENRRVYLSGSTSISWQPDSTDKVFRINLKAFLTGEDNFYLLLKNIPRIETDAYYIFNPANMQNQKLKIKINK